MTKAQLQQRTKSFHISVIKVCGSIARNVAGFETARQLIRSAGSVGANYRAALRAKSSKDFAYKIRIILEEADESLYWLEVCEDAELIGGENLKPMITEAGELVRIFAATLKSITSKIEKS